MKSLLTTIINYYNESKWFHLFVSGAEGAIVAALVSWDGGIPRTKEEMLVLLAFLGKALWGWWKRWSVQNLATVAVAMPADTEKPVLVVK